MLQTVLFPDERVDDALGAAYCAATAPALRRAEGITLTPEWLVHCMVEHMARNGPVDTVVDAGAGAAGPS